MDWKQLLIKIGKGALTAGGASIGTSIAMGSSPSLHMLAIAASAAAGAAFHGLWNAAEQYLSGFKA